MLDPRGKWKSHPFPLQFQHITSHISHFSEVLNNIKHLLLRHTSTPVIVEGESERLMSACLNSAQQSRICFVFFHNLSCCGIVCCELIKVMQQGEEPLTYLLRLYFEGLLLFLLHCVFNKSMGTFILGCVRPRTALARCISIIQSLSE